MRYLVEMRVDGASDKYIALCETMCGVEWEVDNYWTRYHDYKGAFCEVYALTESIDVTAIKDRACEKARQKAEEDRRRVAAAIQQNTARAEARERAEYLRLKEKYEGKKDDYLV